MVKIVMNYNYNNKNGLKQKFSWCWQTLRRI